MRGVHGWVGGFPMLSRCLLRLWARRGRMGKAWRAGISLLMCRVVRARKLRIWGDCCGRPTIEGRTESWNPRSASRYATPAHYFWFWWGENWSRDGEGKIVNVECREWCVVVGEDLTGITLTEVVVPGVRLVLVGSAQLFGVFSAVGHYGECWGDKEGVQFRWPGSDDGSGWFGELVVDFVPDGSKVGDEIRNSPPEVVFSELTTVMERIRKWNCMIS